MQHRRASTGVHHEGIAPRWQKSFCADEWGADDVDVRTCEIVYKVMPSAGGFRVPQPTYATAGSAGLDLQACLDDAVTLCPGARVAIPTGIAIEMPAGMVGLVFPRSGLATKHGIVLSNCVGVVDSDYRGPIICGLLNQSSSDYVVFPGHRVAQLVFVPVLRVDLSLAEELRPTDRGQGGFGSTGT